MKIYFIEWKYIFYRMKIYFYRIRIFLSNENIFLSNENNFYRMQIYFYRMKIIFIEFCYISATIAHVKLSHVGRLVQGEKTVKKILNEVKKRHTEQAITLSGK